MKIQFLQEIASGKCRYKILLKASRTIEKSQELQNWNFLKFSISFFVWHPIMHILLPHFMIFFYPLCHIKFLQFSCLHDRWRVQRVFVSQIQVMCAIFYEHGNEAIGKVLGNSASWPWIKFTVAEKKRDALMQKLVSITKQVIYIFFFTTKWNSAASLSRELLGNVRVEETIDRARIFKTW